MKAKEGTRYGKNDRTQLQEVIPLDTPYLLFIDPSSTCNFKCTFCPCGAANKDQWDVGKKVGRMTYEMYRKIIDQACEFPHQIKTLRLYKEGEPLMNKRLPDMIHYARKKNVAQKIDFTTNGSLLNPDLSLALMDAGIDCINISIEALNEEGYFKNAGTKLDFKKFIKNLEYLYKHKGNCHIFMKISDFGLGGVSKENFYQLFGDLCDEIAVEYISPVWPGFDLSHIQNEFENGIYGDADCQVKDCCPHIFYSMCINSDGSVSCCLMDWNHQCIIGNIEEETLLKLWNNPMRNMQMEHLRGNRSHYSICAHCGQLKFAAIDNIDAYRKKLLGKY